MKYLLVVLTVIITSCHSTEEKEELDYKPDSIIKKEILKEISGLDFKNYSYMLVTKNNKIHDSIIGVASGFITEYNQNFYLITAYHVLSGKNPDTKKLHRPEKGIPTSVYVKFRSAKDDTKFINVEYPLFFKDGRQRFAEIFISKTGAIIDITVMKIQFPGSTDLKFFYLKNSDLDISDFVENGTKITAVGFPYGTFIDGWKPREMQCHVMKAEKSTPPIIGMYGDSVGHSGMSGCPIYKDNKVISVLSGEPNDKTAKLTAIYVHCALKVIKKMDTYKNSPPSIGQYH